MITVIHVNTERTWRGGEGQVFELATRLPSDEFHSIVAAPFKSALLDRIKESGITAVPLRSTGEVSYRQYQDLKRAAQHYQADVFHVHTSHGLISAGLVRDRKCPGMNVVYARRTDFHLRTGFLGISKRKYLWGADRIVSVSDAIKNILIADGIPGDRVTTIYSGIDLTRFNPVADDRLVREELDIPPDAPVVCMVAALAPHKDPVNFLKASEILGRQFPEAIFLLVGAGELWEEMERLKNRSGISGRFIMTGFRRDVPRLLSAVDVFCMSSREEGLCTSILDAMAMGIPVAATYAGGIPEAVKDGVTGLLAPVEDSAALADCIATLLENTTLRRALGAAGRQRVEEHFDIEHTVKKTADLYRELHNER